MSVSPASTPSATRINGVEPGATVPVVPAARAVGAVVRHDCGNSPVHALDGVSVGIAAGVVTAVVGPRGAGKSSLLRCLAGIDPLSGGQRFLCGVELEAMPAGERVGFRRRHTSFVSEDADLDPTLTIGESILSAAPRSSDAPEGRDRTWFVEVVGALGLAGILDRRPVDVSPALQRRAVLARALVALPEVVFVDESTDDAASHHGPEVHALLRRMVADRGNTVVVVTHDAVAAAAADRVLFLADGQVVGDVHLPEPVILDGRATVRAA